MIWKVVITPTALKMVKAITDARIRRKIAETIDSLMAEPDKKGKALIGEFAGFRSIRAVGQRYRIIYQVRGSEIIVVVVAVGIRRHGGKDDIYSLAKKLIKLHILDEK